MVESSSNNNNSDFYRNVLCLARKQKQFLEMNVEKFAVRYNFAQSVTIYRFWNSTENNQRKIGARRRKCELDEHIYTYYVISNIIYESERAKRNRWIYVWVIPLPFIFLFMCIVVHTRSHHMDFQFVQKLPVVFRSTAFLICLNRERGQN